MNQLARRKLNFEIELLDPHALVQQTMDVYLDPPCCIIVKSVMTKRAQIKRAL
jgi:hypothetical protein